MSAYLAFTTQLVPGDATGKTDCACNDCQISLVNYPYLFVYPYLFGITISRKVKFIPIEKIEYTVCYLRTTLKVYTLGRATIAAVRPLFEEWLEKRLGVLTFRLTQVLTGHGCCCCRPGGVGNRHFLL